MCMVWREEEWGGGRGVVGVWRDVGLGRSCCVDGENMDEAECEGNREIGRGGRVSTGLWVVPINCMHGVRRKYGWWSGMGYGRGVVLKGVLEESR